MLGLNVQIDNPTTILAFVPLMIHILGTLDLLFGIICIRDYSFIPILEQHPIFVIFFTLFLLVEYKLVWLLSSGLFGL